MRVEGYHGWVSIDGRRYEEDIVIHVDGSVTERATERSLPFRSDYFHTPLSELELDFLEREHPQIVYIGVGFKGMMNLTPRAKDTLSSYELVVRPTQEVLAILQVERRGFVAILHLTC